MPADLFSVRDLVSAWGRSERWVRDAIHRGRLRAARLGNGWIVTDEERARFESSADFQVPEGPIEDEGHS